MFRATIVRISPVAGVRVTMRAALLCLLCLTALVAVSAIPTISRETNAAQHDSVEVSDSNSDRPPDDSISKPEDDWKRCCEVAGQLRWY